MIKNQIEMSVCSVKGGKIKEYELNGFKFIEAQENSEFILKIRNNSSRRALATISIDGRDAISGVEAQNSDEGYIVAAYSQTEIKGFRISDDEIATFKFSSGNKSYATHLEKFEGKIKDGESATNNGVIGIKITWEKEKPIPQVIYRDRIVYKDRWPFDQPYYPSVWMGAAPAYTSSLNSEVRCFNANNAINSEVIPLSIDNSQSKVANLNNVLRSAQFDMGTAFGEKKNDRIIHVSFERSSEVFTMEIHYASRSALECMGVDLNPKKSIAIPSAFGEKKYCVPPQNW